MEGSNILQTLAEVAVTLTGFSGIVVALGGRSGEVFTEFTENRFGSLLAGSLAALLFALLPFLLHYLGLTPQLVWSICSGAVALYMIPVVYLDVQAFRRSSGELSSFDRRAAPVIGILGVSLWIAQLTNAVLVHEFGIYLAAPMWFLAFSGLAFVRLIVDLRKTQPGKLP